MRQITRMATLTTVTLCALPALAAMPRYDVKAYCTEIAAVGGEYSEMMYDSCFDMEQSSYDALKPRWDGLSGSMQRYCDEIARVGGAGSYTMLESCIRMEQQAGAADKAFEY